MASLDDTEDVALDFGAEDDWKRHRAIRYPVAAVAHLFFRVCALLAYLFCNLFSSSFILDFVVTVLLLAVDFWVVKNVTGRLLVGLRWWNHVDEDGTSHWVFEARKGSRKNEESGTESRLFWFGLVVCPIFWVVFVFTNIFTLRINWLIITTVGVILNGANLYGYIRCKIGSRKELSSIATQFLGQQILKSAMSSATRPQAGQ